MTLQRQLRVATGTAGGTRPSCGRAACRRERDSRGRGGARASRSVAERTGDVSLAQDLQKARLVTAIKTPYLPNGKFDLRAYDRLLCSQVAQGCDAVIVGGTTGEGQLMSWDEHIMLIAYTVNNFGKDLKVIGNTGSNCTREALHATDQGFNVGMHGSLQINPYYGKTSTRGLFLHFNAVMDLGPAMIYNVPSRTGQDLTPDIIESLASHSNFVGVKECMGNERIAGYSRQGICCWSGNDDEAHDARHEAGAVGVVSVASNVIPGIYAKMMGAEAQPELNAQVQALVAWLFAEPNPIGINTCLAMTGMAQPVCRLPYAPYDKEMRQKGYDLMKQLGNEVVGWEELRVLEDAEFQVLRWY